MPGDTPSSPNPAAASTQSQSGSQSGDVQSGQTQSGQTQSGNVQTGDAQSSSEIRSGFCAILGLPNAGKSTLLNQVLNMRLAAVSNKPQTTRNRILGVHNVTLPAREDLVEQPVQIIFVDTPGIQQGPGALRRYMRDQSLGAAGDADVALLMVDMGDPAQHDPARFQARDTADLLSALRASKARVILALNKVDTVRQKDGILPVIAAYAETGMAEEIIPISAKSGDGVGRLVDAIGRRLPVGPRLFPEDMVTDRAERFLAAELIREQLFHQLGQELPYATAVVVESFEERPNRGDVVIGAIIYVERESQKGIVVGKGGQRIKEVGQAAREAVSQLLGCPAHVKLYVKVSTNWSRIERGIREMGYE